MIVGAACQPIVINLPTARQALISFDVLLLPTATTSVQRNDSPAGEDLRVHVILIGCETRGINLCGTAGAALNAGDFGFGVVVDIAVKGKSDDWEEASYYNFHRRLNILKKWDWAAHTYDTLCFFGFIKERKGDRTFICESK